MSLNVTKNQRKRGNGLVRVLHRQSQKCSDPQPLLCLVELPQLNPTSYRQVVLLYNAHIVTAPVRLLLQTAFCDLSSYKCEHT